MNHQILFLSAEHPCGSRCHGTGQLSWVLGGVNIPQGNMLPRPVAGIQAVPEGSVEITIISACTMIRCQSHPKNASGQDRFSFPLMKGGPKCCRGCIFLQFCTSAWINHGYDGFEICHTTAAFLSLPAWVSRCIVQYDF